MTRLHLATALAVTVAASFCAVAAEIAGAQAPTNPPSQGPAQPSKADTKNTDDGKKTPRKRVVSDLSGFDLLGSGKQTMVVGATRSVTRPAALAPHLGRVYAPTPVFFWGNATESDKLLFVLEDEARREVFQKEVRGSSFRYPADAPRLEPGKTYFWSVAISLGALGSVQSDRVGFLVLSPAERKEVEKELVQLSSADAFHQSLDRAQVYTQNRLWYDAVDAYCDLIARFPDHPELYEQRGMIYAQIESTRPLAERDFARADSLTPARP